MNDNTATGLINQTTPASSPLDTLKALVHRNLSMLEYLQGQDYLDEDMLEFVDAIRDMNYEALNEHVAIEAQWIGRFHQRRILEAGYTYDDGTPVYETFDSGMTSTYYPRYGGNRDSAQACHYKSTADMYLRFAEEMEAKAEGREWPPVEENADDNTESLNGPSEG